MQLKYQLRRPAVPDGRPPLLVLLHAKGDNEHDMAALATRLDPRFLTLSLQAPFALTGTGYRWFNTGQTAAAGSLATTEAEHSRLAVIQCINDAVMGFGVDPRRVYLLGFSQGATLAWSIALTAPRLLRGVVGIAGCVLPEIAARQPPTEAVGHLTVFIQHGVHDPVIARAKAQATRDLWVDLGAMMGYREYAAAHELTPSKALDGAVFLHTQINRWPLSGSHYRSRAPDCAHLGSSAVVAQNYPHRHGRFLCLGCATRGPGAAWASGGSGLAG